MPGEVVVLAGLAFLVDLPLAPLRARVFRSGWAVYARALSRSDACSRPTHRHQLLAPGRGGGEHRFVNSPPGAPGWGARHRIADPQLSVACALKPSVALRSALGGSTCPILWVPWRIAVRPFNRRSLSWAICGRDRLPERVVVAETQIATATGPVIPAMVLTIG